MKIVSSGKRTTVSSEDLGFLREEAAHRLLVALVPLHLPPEDFAE
jgi:hypothetical protein